MFIQTKTHVRINKLVSNRLELLWSQDYPFQPLSLELSAISFCCCTNGCVHQSNLQNLSDTHLRCDTSHTSSLGVKCSMLVNWVKVIWAPKNGPKQFFPKKSHILNILSLDFSSQEMKENSSFSLYFSARRSLVNTHDTFRAPQIKCSLLFFGHKKKTARF